jgi:colanic acid/amylovoran/stewartan biosynthesis glycosyltransferase WcaL/AmsK/CpsK
MKIAVILGGFPKLSETFILRQLTGLADLGHEIDIYARRNPREASVQPDVQRYGFLARTQYYEVPAGRLARAARALATFVRAFPRHPVAMLHCLNLARYRSVYALLNNVIFAAPFLDRRYDVIYCFWGGNGTDFIVLKDLFPETRFVNRFGGDDYALGDELGADALALLRERADAFIVQTDCYGRATLRRYGFDDAKIATYRHVIAVDDISFRERRFDGERLRLVTVARLVEKKGLDHGIRAVAALQARNPHLRVEYRIIGDGPLAGRLADRIQELKAGEVIELLGARTTPEVMRWIGASDIFLLPSLMEQAGYVLLEAQATGIPVVATRVGGVPEMVREGRSAILVDAGDAPALTAALQGLADHPEDWPAMGREGRAHVEAHHNIERLKPRLAEILRGRP